MIVDTSALVAILFEEPEGERFEDAILDAEKSLVAAGSWLEISAVLTRSRREELFGVLNAIVSRLGVTVAPMNVSQTRIGHEAYRRYGTGSGHSARLNFGDCFPYALAKELDQPLLFKGDDFIHTDVKQAIPR